MSLVTTVPPLHSVRAVAAAYFINGPQPSMMSGDLIGLAIIAALLLIYLLPLIWVLISDRSSGGAKFGWFLVALFFSWVGLAVFLIVTKAPEASAETEYPSRRYGLARPRDPPE